MLENFADLGLWLLGVVVMAAAIHYGFVRLYPYLAMRVVFKKGAKQLGINEIAHRKKPTARMRVVVRPSPDLVYSGCVFDLSKGPLQICAQLPGTYMSVSMYASNTDNFFSLNDREVESDQLNLLLVGPQKLPAALREQILQDPSAPLIVRSPSRKGIVLLRYFYDGSEAEAEQVEHIRRQTTVSPWRAYAPTPPVQNLSSES